MCVCLEGGGRRVLLPYNLYAFLAFLQDTPATARSAAFVFLAATGHRSAVSGLLLVMLPTMGTFAAAELVNVQTEPAVLVLTPDLDSFAAKHLIHL